MNILFASVLSDTFEAGSFFTMIFSALVIGIFIAVCYGLAEKTSKSFLITLSILPVIVAVIIMMVNGNIGAGVAVAGAFSLIRFRSAQGSGKEISVIFLEMAAGLCIGMGYIGIAGILSVIVVFVFFVIEKSGWGDAKNAERILKITVPETLDFDGIFDDLFNKYTIKHEVLDVRTSGMGALYKLTYRVEMNDMKDTKEFIDQLRSRNGNLEISLSRETDEYNSSL